MIYWIIKSKLDRRENKSSGIAILKVLFFFIFWVEVSHCDTLPNICTVAKAAAFNSCVDLKTKLAFCGNIIPRPCVHFSYYVPQYFIEVSSNPKESLFSLLPGVMTQLVLSKSFLPFGAEDDGGAYSFHAHTINVPFTMMGFAGMPCGGMQMDNMCFTAMSEHLGMNWKTGLGDAWQPQWLAWGLAPKACLMKGAITSALGGSRATGYPAHSAMCSFDRSWITKYPPSNQAVCNGWGIIFPRYGTVINSDQTTASLVIASRIRSLGSEVFQSLPTSSDEKWQMIYPSASACFREGENVGILRAKAVNESGRIWNGKIKNYLYVVWKRVHCIRDVPFLATTYAWKSILQSACRGNK